MKPADDLFDKIAEDYSLLILKWAIKKTGSRADGEDLSQEVLYQVLSFVKGKTKIEKLDNLIWKIAHYTWCNRLRKSKKENNLVSLDSPAGLYIVDERDCIDEIAGSEASKEELFTLRRKISELSKMQREIIIAYYLENLPVSDIASKFGVSKSAVKWHLFDARNKIKEKMEKCDMDDNLNMLKPGKLFLGSHGDRGPDPDTKRVNDNLIRQNICLLCYGDSGKTIGELAEMTGIPRPYLEFDLDWLADREFLLLENKKYITNFGIKNRQHFHDVKNIYIKYKEDYYQKIIGYLNAHERDIRNIGFFGSDFEWNKLLWSILTLYLKYFSESEPLKTLKIHNTSKCFDEYELHKDGGRYVIFGFDQSENQGVDLSKGGVLTEPVSEPEKWGIINGIWCGGVNGYISEFTNTEKPEENYRTYWFGLYIFANQPPVITRDSPDRQKGWKQILKSLLENDFAISDLDNEWKEKLADAVKENIIKKEGGRYIPQFAIFSFAQFEKLYAEIFEPLVRSIKPRTLELIEMFTKLNEGSLPRKIHGYVDRWTYFDIWDSGIKNIMFAADDGYLYMPKTPEEGAGLTLSFVY